MPRYEDYRIIRQLPGGAQSKTYLVELKSTRQQFIMKKVNYLEQVDKAKADVEVELMRQLDSDFTVHLVCIVETDVELCMILEYCVRGDLRNLIDEFQQLPESEKLMRGWEYTAQITRALDHLHSHNVMHRDLKPANILVNQDGTIRLGDFGLSREMNEDYYLTIAGTKVYMAPEVHLLKRMNKQSDIFSLGVIIFQLITGHHPYEADSEEAMIDKIKKNKVSELPDWVSNQMKELITSMMNINENHRPTTKMILSHDTILMSLRLFKATSSPQPITVNLQVPTGMRGHKDRNIFIHDDNTLADCTISTDPIISEGIVYYETVFEKDDRWPFALGIADSSVVFKPNKGFWEDELKGKTVYYRCDGQLAHINLSPDNQEFVSGQRIGVEVNMSSSPRKLTFFIDDVEQQYYVINIPQAIRFWSFIRDPNSSFTVTRFERRSSSSAHGVTGSKGLEWGKDWEEDE
ncbi:MAG: putative Serine/threonine protein kinase [Streblomastix strix]|uniref:non-specific serine/threonine protein kinase n=1 Tax=Streblomastix strix TaxID=222440 RepID=A0A5J4UXM4_9EUKA|nr:MAG: putative Serine/threonine protein kinase [Streblomastix strix]